MTYFVRLGLALALLGAAAASAAGQQRAHPTIELRGGWWLAGDRFVRTRLYVSDGAFSDRKPARVDTVVDLANLYVLPPFGDAHVHLFDNPGDVGRTRERLLQDGIFYALSLTGSAAGRRSVADSVNPPWSVDVAYADALTATRGHPILSAEVTANRVAAHVETAEDFRVAARAGVDIVAHLPGLAPKAGEDVTRYRLTEGDARLAARNQVAVIPTGWLAERLAAPRPWLTGEAAGGDTAQFERAKAIQRASLAQLNAQGVALAVGSDLFETAVTEASYLVTLGVFRPAEVLGMWTRDTPRLIFPRRRIGELAPGFEGSLVAVACDPTVRFECVGEIRVRLKQGHLFPADR